MFKILYALIQQNKIIDMKSNVDITKPGEIGKIILYNNNLYVYDGTSWISFSGQKNELNILQTPIPFEGLIYKNTQNNIQYYEKPKDAQPWAGVTFFNSNSNIISPNTHKISVYVNSPKNNVTVMLKIENKANSNEFQEVQTIVSNKDTLTNLIFDFDGNKGSVYNMISIFFDFLQQGDNSIYGLGEYSLL